MRRSSLVALLLCLAFVVPTFAGRQTPLMKAVDAGNIEKVRKMIGKGVDLDACVGKYPYSALNEAAWESEEMVRLLVEAGADIHTKCDGDPPLYYAAGIKPFALAVLIEAGADVNEPADHSYYPLHNALTTVDRSKQAEAVKLLLDAGADTSVTTSGGMTPLMRAAQVAESIEPVRLLLDAGADPLAFDSENQTAADYVELGDDDRDRSLLKELRELFATHASEFEAKRQAEELRRKAQDRLVRADELAERDSRLPTEIRRDKYMIALTGHLKNERYGDALGYFAALERMEIELDPSFEFYYGEALYESGLPDEAMDRLYAYLNTAGSTGSHYTRALELVTLAEESRSR